MMSIGFVYCWTDHKEEKLYVGVRKGNPNDGYICSSNYMMEQYKQRPADFTRQIIAEGNWEDMRLLESAILQSVDAKNNPSFYNMHNNSSDFVLKAHNEKTKAKISKARMGTQLSEETKEKMRRNNLGKTIPAETRAKISRTTKGVKKKPRRPMPLEANQRRAESLKRAYAEGKRVSVYKGKTLSEETKAKMRQSHQKRLAAMKEIMQ